MQISSATMPTFGNQPLSANHAVSQVEGTTSHADGQIPAGSSVPVEQSHKSAETADFQAGAKEHHHALDNKALKSESEKTTDPLNDPSSAEYAQVKELSARDREVRAHEQAHLSAAGRYATSGATFSYQTGPDGQQYAIGGEVSIDVSAVPDDPEATIAKMQVVQSAATAPAEPSSQDVRVAAQAAQTAAVARAELAAQQFDKTQSAGDTEKSAVDTKQAEVAQTSNEREASQSYSAQQNEESRGNFSASV